MSASGPALDFRTLFEGAPGLYLVLAVDPPRFTIVAATESYLRATMTRRNDIVGRGLFEVFPDNPEDPAATGVANLRASLDRVLETGRPDTMAVQKYDIRRPEGSFEQRFWSPVNSPVLGGDGRVHHVVHRVEDVTEFVRIAAARTADRAAADALRMRESEMELELFQRAQEIQGANQRLLELQEQLEQRVEERTAELRHEMAQRERAERALRRSEDQLRQAQKLEAIGRLAGGIAHDFNNLLSVIACQCEFTRADLPDLDAARVNLDTIAQAARCAADLTRQLLAFSRQQVISLVVLDLNDVVANLSKMMRRLVGEDVELTMQLAPQVLWIRADRGQIEQVLMNLVVNARDALPDGGSLTIQTGLVVLDTASATEHPDATPGPYATLTVSDTGTGMDPGIQAQVFEPFFTTKERGKGTGLGLSTVFGIVRQLGGHIGLYSEPGYGTTFDLYFPSVTEDERKPSTRPTPPAPRGETVLVTEDHGQVRAVACSILRRAGFRVLEAATPEDALRICREHVGVIHLLLTDVIMPTMSGHELAERALAVRPTLSVLFMSGYTDDVLSGRRAMGGPVHLVEKPLAPDRLVSKIREVLGEREVEPLG